MELEFDWEKQDFMNDLQLDSSTFITFAKNSWQQKLSIISISKKKRRERINIRLSKGENRGSIMIKIKLFEQRLSPVT